MGMVVPWSLGAGQGRLMERIVKVAVTWWSAAFTSERNIGFVYRLQFRNVLASELLVEYVPNHGVHH